MKKQILFWLFVFTSLQNNAQEYLHINVQSPQFSYTPISNEQHQFHFSIGILDYYVPTMSSVVEVVNDTLEVKMFYDITQQVVNFSNLNIYDNDVYYNEALPENVTHIKMSVNVILIEDNPPYNIITVESLYYRIIDLSNMSIQSNTLLNAVIAPNPTAGTCILTTPQKFDQIKVFDLLGKEIWSMQPSDVTTQIKLDHCQPGVYLVKLIRGNQEVIQKLVVE